MKFPFLEGKARLIRIMETFDLATGHGDTMDELLDSLESELRDVLGYYREALKQREWVGLTDEELPEGATYEFDRGARWAETRLKEKNT